MDEVRPCQLLVAALSRDEPTLKIRVGGSDDKNMLGATFRTNVVVVGADHRRRKACSKALGEMGYGVSSASTGLAGIEQALEEACDAVVVELPLPDMESRQFFGMMRAVGDIPIVAVTTGGESPVGALDDGADDALGDPWEPDELDARLQAALRRRAETTDDEWSPVRIGGLAIDPAAREARIDGRVVELSRKEFDLLHALARRPNRVVSKQELMAEVWGRGEDADPKTIDVHLSWLRRKLGETAAQPKYLKTVRGVGYMLAKEL
jgi:DNA-binding response OmpR family regulator